MAFAASFCRQPHGGYLQHIGMRYRVAKHGLHFENQLTCSFCTGQSGVLLQTVPLSEYCQCTDGSFVLSSLKSPDEHCGRCYGTKNIFKSSELIVERPSNEKGSSYISSQSSHMPDPCFQPSDSLINSTTLFVTSSSWGT